VGETGCGFYSREIISCSSFGLMLSNPTYNITATLLCQMDKYICQMDKYISQMTNLKENFVKKFSKKMFGLAQYNVWAYTIYKQISTPTYKWQSILRTSSSTEKQ
jgi:hypothetical protein